MLKVFLLIITIAISIFLSAQSERTDSKTVAEKYEHHYNAGNYDSIFSMFSSTMQGALPIDKTRQFLSDLKVQAGNIITRKFSKYEKGTFASYKTNFEKALFSLKISIDNNSLINGFSVTPFTDEQLPKRERNSTKLLLPFRGEWSIVWGGDTKELNYHVENQAQKNAFDILILDAKGSSHKGDGAKNEDYYAFGKEIIAPCDGEIVLSVDGVKDNKPGESDFMYVVGNSVIIKAVKDEYLVFAHLKQHSVKVKQGQKVKQGEVLGLCGNSGHSSEPHLHFHLQNVENMNVATGVKCYFDKILVSGETKRDYSPVKMDKVSN